MRKLWEMDTAYRLPCECFWYVLCHPQECELNSYTWECVCFSNLGGQFGRFPETIVPKVKSDWQHLIVLRSCPGTRDMEEMSFDLRGDYLVAVEQATIFVSWEAYSCCCCLSCPFIGEQWPRITFLMCWSGQKPHLTRWYCFGVFFRQGPVGHSGSLGVQVTFFTVGGLDLATLSVVGFLWKLLAKKAGLSFLAEESEKATKLYKKSCWSAKWCLVKCWFFSEN